MSTRSTPAARARTRSARPTTLAARISFAMVIAMVLVAAASAHAQSSASMRSGASSTRDPFASPPGPAASTSARTTTPSATTSSPAEGGLTLPAVELRVGGGEGGGPQKTLASLRMLGVLTVLALLPALVLSCTGFTRIVVVLGFLKQAIGSSGPPNQVLVGLALFMTAAVMAPTAARIDEEALEPYSRGDITEEQALERAAVPMRAFMLAQTREPDLRLFYEVTGAARPNRPADVPLRLLVPAFVVSELTTAFEMGFLLFVPFMLIDFAASSVLMSMGMVMVSPQVVALPVKLLVFVLADGWNLVIASLMRSFA